MLKLSKSLIDQILQPQDVLLLASIILRQVFYFPDCCNASFIAAPVAFQKLCLIA